MTARLNRAWARLRAYFAPHPCARCPRPSRVLYVKTGVRVVYGTAGTSICVRRSATTPPPEWLCRGCAAAAMSAPGHRTEDVPG